MGYLILALYVAFYILWVTCCYALLQYVKKNMARNNGNNDRNDFFNACIVSVILSFLATFFWCIMLVTNDMHNIAGYTLCVILLSLFWIPFAVNIPIIFYKKGPGWLLFQDKKTYIPENTAVKFTLGFFYRPDLSKRHFYINDQHQGKSIAFDLKFTAKEYIPLDELETIINQKISPVITVLVQNYLIEDNDGFYTVRQLRKYLREACFDHRITVKAINVLFQIFILRNFPDDDSGYWGDDENNPLDSLPPIISQKTKV